MSQEKTTLWQILLTILSASALIFLPKHAVIIFFTLAVALGISHGATDIFLLHRFANNHWGRLLAWIVVYFLLVLCFLLCFLTYTKLSFAIFLLLSAYHFGTTDLHNYALPSKSLLGLSRGLLIFAIIFFCHQQVVLSVCQAVLTTLPAIFLSDFSHFWLYLILANYVIQILAGLRLKNKKSFYLSLHCIILLFTLVNPLVAFALYFVIWHSWQHFNIHVSAKHIDRTFDYVVLAFVTLITLSMIGIVYFYNPSAFSSVESHVLRTFFITIFALTVPHMVLNHRFITAQKQ